MYALRPVAQMSGRSRRRRCKCQPELHAGVTARPHHDVVFPFRPCTSGRSAKFVEASAKPGNLETALRVAMKYVRDPPVRGLPQEFARPPPELLLAFTTSPVNVPRRVLRHFGRLSPQTHGQHDGAVHNRNAMFSHARRNSDHSLRTGNVPFTHPGERRNTPQNEEQHPYFTPDKSKGIVAV